MVRKWLSYILATLIAMQSMMAMADAHQSHQTGTAHIEFSAEHDHGLVDYEIPTQSQADSFTAGQYDCHHCCHCHGVAHLILAIHNFGFDAFMLSHEPLIYGAQYPSVSTSPDIRPPIA